MKNNYPKRKLTDVRDTPFGKIRLLDGYFDVTTKIAYLPFLGCGLFDNQGLFLSLILVVSLACFAIYVFLHNSLAKLTCWVYPDHKRGYYRLIFASMLSSTSILIDPIYVLFALILLMLLGFKVIGRVTKCARCLYNFPDDSDFSEFPAFVEQSDSKK